MIFILFLDIFVFMLHIRVTFQLFQQFYSLYLAVDTDWPPKSSFEGFGTTIVVFSVAHYVVLTSEVIFIKRKCQIMPKFRKNKTFSL